MQNSFVGFITAVLLNYSITKNNNENALKTNDDKIVQE